ncbi:MAG: xylulokinase [Chloroflexota bacterium]|nr:xylulokinase [Chloroflexota bacterium]
MNCQYILAHDLGTTGNKATLFASDGTVVASTFVGYETDYPQPNWVEQDPADWREALFGATRRLLSESGVNPGEVAVVSFSGHMNGALVVDAAGVPLRPAIIWADQRATDQECFIRDRCGNDETYRVTGNRVSPAYTAAKLLWIKDNQPEVFGRIHKVLQAKDYAAFLFCGVLATDYSDASMTQLLDLEELTWSGDLLDRLELDELLLPELHTSATVIGEVTVEAASATGLRAGTPVVIGGGDGACASVGAGSVRDGEVYNYIGSSSWVALTTDKPVLDPLQRTFNFVHLDPSLYGALGTTQTAGGAYDWFERLVRVNAEQYPQYATLDGLAAGVPPGSQGLLFLPYLLGERSPHWNPLARGAFVGLAMSHGRPELARSVLEGVAFNLRHILDVLRVQGVAIPEMRLIGGGAKSKLWRQILADVYALPVVQLQLPAQATSLGAAVAGGIGVGLFPDYTVVQDLAPAISRVYPDPDAVAIYEGLFPLFKKTYCLLEPVFQELATFARQAIE